MKTKTAFTIITAVFLATCMLRSAEKSKWQTDWTEFGKELTAVMGKSGVMAHDIDQVFNGKEVEWTGEVAAIQNPDAKQKQGSIKIKMNMVTFAVGGNDKAELSELTLTPKDENEWKSWADIKVGARVTFRTTLKTPGLPGMAAVGVLRGAGPNAGKIRAYVNADGAMMTEKKK